MDEAKFLKWVDTHDGGITMSELRKEWPEFFDDGYHKSLTGVTVTLGDDGEPVYPKRDIRQCVTVGGPLD